MTWIVGTSSLFGYAAAVSDVQVTWPGGRHLDCLQKVYPAIPIVAFGFSGSVRIGFHLLEDFRRNFLRGLSEGQARPVRICAHDWYRRARWIFKRLPPDERELGSSIILLGVSPQERFGAGPFPRTDVVVMESRSDFVPCYVKRLECVGIGSGNDVNEYVKEIELRNRSGGRNEMEFEGFMPQGRKLAFDVAYALKKYPIPG